ncbi:hypothetical protein BCR34DRAFT_564734 [Clohesyomyces aquaticus]|uniref:Ubiquitin-like domain-containing protein n=1 Tax=Clohesyomyces aquaticus TaxID=1231657 RepID=A0A1Y1ZNJ6_9PLEO|nr:hypothetical protein BCR34DRAFT_564734 [Clohesyomyces aquaticus]
MAAAKDLEVQQYRDFLYIEEATSDEGEGSRINFSTSQTVEELKRAIAAQLNIPQQWSYLELVMGTTELTELNRRLDSYGVFDGDTIYYVRDTPPASRPPPYTPSANPSTKILNNVMFRDLDGKTLVLHGVPISWTVKQLRNKLGVEKHLSDQVGDFRFICNGKQLQDERILETYGMVDSCTINIVLRLKGGA